MPPQQAAEAWALQNESVNDDDGRFRRVFAHRSDAVLGAGLALVALAVADDLAVAGLEAEAELFALIKIQLKLGMLQLFACGLVLYMGQAVPANAFNAALAGVQRGIALAGGDDLAVARDEVEAILAVATLDNLKLAHSAPHK